MKIDLTGGYYDAGDNVKFGFPMAFTISMLSWSVLEFRYKLQEKNELLNALDAIQWSTDYQIKAHPKPNLLYGEVGDGDSDHACWQRPEDMTTPRIAYKIDEQHPGADLAGETAAAFAVYDFASLRRGQYQNSIPGVQKFYSSSGYKDELRWSAPWLYRATGERQYLLALVKINTGGVWTQLSWDDKFVGAQILVAKLLMEDKFAWNCEGLGNPLTVQALKAMTAKKIRELLCNGSPIPEASRAVYMRRQFPQDSWWTAVPFSNLQYTSTAAFVSAVYAKYIEKSQEKVGCPGGQAEPSELIAFARSQAGYILRANPNNISYTVAYGSRYPTHVHHREAGYILRANPNNISYTVAYGSRYPTHVHHRGASIILIKNGSAPVPCSQGYGLWLNRDAPDLNVLHGTIVGGPDRQDGYVDARMNYQQAEPTTINTAPLVGLLASLA
ncbi:LOW QUALITY PROTEIN: hypothetical protein EUGRSUZ_L02852 [Eucalyptus grandis]|uniref:cellulase n=1 Tax=Eucalyptus grandis TaxID=71139 RepID=A0AAD9T8V4_EUCGR|nr:LOW QUALITY PROTEIN: hypothetical protein EUGRSUZ_L02852 [Eucalyptus grandis]